MKNLLILFFFFFIGCGGAKDSTPPIAGPDWEGGESPDFSASPGEELISNKNKILIPFDHASADLDSLIIESPENSFHPFQKVYIQVEGPSQAFELVFLGEECEEENCMVADRDGKIAFEFYPSPHLIPGLYTFIAEQNTLRREITLRAEL